MTRALSAPGFLGRGWKFPVAFNASDVAAGPAMAEGMDDIKQSIRLILSITPGERQMVPDFGCNLLKFAFQPVDLTVSTKIQVEVQRALLHFEPRIIVDTVEVTVGDDTGQRIIQLKVKYTVRSTNRRDNVVFKYYCHQKAGGGG